MGEQSAVTFIIGGGECTYLLTEAAPQIEGAVSRRASHVYPRNFLLRTLFRVLRCWLGDKGRMSNFTRSWRCAWIVDARPVGGQILSTIYYDRKQAIDAEVVYLNKFFTEAL